MMSYISRLMLFAATCTLIAGCSLVADVNIYESHSHCIVPRLDSWLVAGATVLWWGCCWLWVWLKVSMYQLLVSVVISFTLLCNMQMVYK